MTALAINSVEFNFESHNIRTVIIENEPWFVAVDVCNVLGIQNPSKALKALDDDERSNFKLGRQGEANIINESGLYTLILRCRDAVKQGTLPWRFRKWVTNEVLPTIRKTGRYQKQPPSEPLNSNDMSNLKRLVWMMTGNMKFENAWNAGVWYALRSATGRPSPQPFSVDDLPALGEECRRILTAPRPEGRGFPLQRAEPKPRAAIQDLQALRGLTLPARQL
ncbi:Bro-N domain-containing protein [Salmonella enterica]|nr:Bro-N domain-containing protein [Salmonella enterica]